MNEERKPKYKVVEHKSIYGSQPLPEPTDFIGKILYKAPMRAVIFYENFLFYAFYILALGFSIGCLMGLA